MELFPTSRKLKLLNFSKEWNRLDEILQNFQEDEIFFLISFLTSRTEKKEHYIINVNIYSLSLVCNTLLKLNKHDFWAHRPLDLLTNCKRSTINFQPFKEKTVKSWTRVDKGNESQITVSCKQRYKARVTCGPRCQGRRRAVSLSMLLVKTWRETLPSYPLEPTALPSWTFYTLCSY